MPYFQKPDILPYIFRHAHIRSLIWGGSPNEAVKKKTHKFVITVFTLWFLFLPCRFAGFRHSIRIKQTWRGSCTCGSQWEITLGLTCWTQLKIRFPSLGRIFMEEWSVGDGVWSWFSGQICHRFCYCFVSRIFSQSVVRGTYEYLICSCKC